MCPWRRLQVPRPRSQALLWNRNPLDSPGLAPSRLKWKALLWERDRQPTVQGSPMGEGSTLPHEYKKVRQKFGATRPHRIQMLFLLHRERILRQPTRSLWTVPRTLMRFLSSRTVPSFLHTAVRNSTWRFVLSIKLLRAQRHAGPNGGFYHDNDNCRNDPVVAFKL